MPARPAIQAAVDAVRIIDTHEHLEEESTRLARPHDWSYLFSHYAGDDLLLAMVAIGEERVIGDIDVMRVGPGADDFAQHREAAKAGIEQENRRRNCHELILADPQLPFSCFDGVGGLGRWAD